MADIMISEESFSFIESYSIIHGPLVVSICIFGILTNVVNIIVLTRRQMIGPTNILLTGLSAAQLLLLCNYLIYTIYIMMDDLCNRWTKTYAWLSYLLLNVNLNLVFHTIALVHTTSLAVFRYAAVAFPVKCKEFVSIIAARRIVIAAFVSVPLLCTTFYPNSVVVQLNVTETECEEWQNEPDEMSSFSEPLFELRYHADRLILRDYNFWFFSTVCKLLPCSLLVILSLLLIRELRRVRKRRRQLSGKPNSSKERNGRQITAMLVVIVSMFVAVELPQGILNMLSAVLKDEFIDTYTNLGDFFEMLTVLYSSVTFILYCTMSRQFRSTFKRLFCRYYRRPQHGDDSWPRATLLVDERRRLRSISEPTASFLHAQKML